MRTSARPLRGSFFLLFLLLSFLLAAPPARSAHADKPTLVVVISADQLAQEYLGRFAENFADDGFFQRVSGHGASFANCHHEHAFTFTGPGHSVLLTGAHPRQTGIIGNGWYDPKLGRDRYCVECAGTHLVGLPPSADATSMSPDSLLAETLGDVLNRTSEGKAKVVGLALKDRAGILMAGRKADAAYWLADRRWITSSWYMENLPGYLRAYNESRPIDAYAGKTWDLVLPKAKYHLYRPDDYEFENDGYGLGRAFPHRLAGRDDKDFDRQFPCTPFGNDATLLAARLIVEHEELGQDDVTDLLCLGLSANDYLGHQYGPYSLEVEDATCRLDRQLADFISFLDETVGSGKWTLVLSADHGVAPIPEFANQVGLQRARNPLGDLSELRAKVEARLREKLGPPGQKENYVLSVADSQVFLTRDPDVLPQGKLKQARQIARDVVLGEDPVFAAVTADLLHGEKPLQDPLEEQLRKTYCPKRSGDVLFVLRPYFMQSRSATTHGSPWDYDTHVPLIFLGAGVKPGLHQTPASPAQIAPSLAQLLEIDPPENCVAKPLAGVFALPERARK